MERLPFDEGWRCRSKVDRFAELAGGAAEWTPVLLPHDAMIGLARAADSDPANAYFPGGAWEYQRLVEWTDEQAGDRLILEFEGVYRDAVVYVNGTIAGRRSYGYSGFFVAIDHLVHIGDDNEIKVECSAHQDARWYSGAGIYRDVWLLQSGPVHLVPGRLEVLTPEIDDEGAVVAVAAVVRNDGATTAAATLVVELVDPDGAVVSTEEAPVTAFPGDELTARLRLHVRDPRRWRLDDPTLYTCRVTLRDGDAVLDEEASPFGIRSLSLDPRHGLRINGEPVLLRGACVHHDNGPLGSATIARADERRVELLKAAGFNALRSAHNPMSRALLDACDRLGVLVMDEAFDMWGQTKTSDDYALRFEECWEADVEAMVRKDVNHPSVILYSIGNEIPDGSTPTGLHRGRALAEKVRGLDPSRYVTQGVTGMLVAGPGIIAEIRDIAAERMVDAETGVNTAALNLGDLMNEAMRSPLVAENTTEAFSHLDVAGYNYMDTRFEIDVEGFPNRLIVGTETHPDRIDVGWSAVTRLPQVIGDFVWTGWDYLGEVGIGRVAYGDPAGAAATGISAFHGDYPWVAAHCGDLDLTGHRRPQSYYREMVFGLRRDPYLAVRRPEHQGRTVVHSSPWSWTDVVSSWSWAGHEGKPVVVEVYADADEVELLVNGASAGRQPAGPDHRFRAEFATTYEPGEVVVVGWRHGEETGRTRLRSAVGPALLDVRVDRSAITADTADLAYVEVTMVDAAGTLHNTADRTVTVEVDGPGLLLGLASGRPDTEEPFAGPTCTTYDGRALAVIRPTGAGAIDVRITAHECEPQVLRIDARVTEPASLGPSLPAPGDSVAETLGPWELRWHPFRGEWVLFTAHRGARPWIGEVIHDEEPLVPVDNALAPGGRRIATTNRDYRGVFTFTNDLPVFSSDAPEPSAGDDLYRTRRAAGTAEVVCYHHDPARSLADLDDDEATAVVTTWRERTRVLQARDEVAHVLIFENRGAAVGTSNPHPHCQIYAGALVYGTMAREAEMAAAHHHDTGRSLLEDVVARELAGPRVISEGEQFLACVPWFARFAYEVHVLPRRPVTSLVDLDDDTCRSLALVLRDVVRRYDALWGLRMPYVLAVHQAPVGDHPHYPFHVELHPPLRAPGLLKYLAGPEVGGGSMTNESDPDEKAVELRDALG